MRYKSLPKDPKIIGITGARGGSKSIPYKNIVPIAGVPMIAYTIQAAKDSKLLDWHIVSTDDPKIKKVAEDYGADAPYFQPDKISTDTSSDILFLRYALKWLKKNRGWEPDIVLNLRATSPLRDGKDIDRVIRIMKKTGCDSIKTVIKAIQPPHKVWFASEKPNGKPLPPDKLYDPNGFSLTPVLHTPFRLKNGPDVQRQRLPIAFWQDAQTDATRAKFILKKGAKHPFGPKFYGVESDERKVVDIDDLRDIKLAEQLLKKLKISKPSKNS